MTLPVKVKSDIHSVKSSCCFGLQWMLVTVVGFLLSLLLIEIGERPHINAVDGAIGGGVIGLAQLLVLRQKLSQAWWWVFASMISWGLIGASSLGALGWVAPRTSHMILRGVIGAVNGAQVGALIGIGQWLLLRKQVPKAWRWIFASTVGWAVGLAIGWTLSGSLRQATRLFLGEVVGLTLGWIVVGSVTGVALVWLLRDVDN